MKRCWIGFALVALFSGAGAALAESYPARPVRLITPQTVGASMDILVRIVAPKLSELLGQPFVVDSRGGAGGVIGTEIGARAAPDGYTLVTGHRQRWSLRADYDRIARLVKIAGIKPE